MEKLKEQIIVNLVTTPEQFSKLLKDFLDKSGLKMPVLPDTNEKEEEELVTVKQASTFFQVSETTIHAWKNSGVLPFIKIKSRIRFRKSEILALYERRRNKISNFQR